MGSLMRAGSISTFALGVSVLLFVVFHGAHRAICGLLCATVGPLIGVVDPFGLFCGPLVRTGRVEVRLSTWVPNLTSDIAASFCLARLGWVVPPVIVAMFGTWVRSSTYYFQALSLGLS
jgi:hypothetical protein